MFMLNNQRVCFCFFLLNQPKGIQGYLPEGRTAGSKNCEVSLKGAGQHFQRQTSHEEFGIFGLYILYHLKHLKTR